MATEGVIALIEASATMVILSFNSGASLSSSARECLMDENITSVIDP